MQIIFWLVLVAVATVVPLFAPPAIVRTGIIPRETESSQPLVKGVSVRQVLRLDPELLAKSRELCISPKFATQDSRGDGTIQLQLTRDGVVIASKEVAGRSIRNNRYVPICTIERSTNLVLEVSGVTDVKTNAPRVQIVDNTILGSLDGESNRSIVVAAEYNVRPVTAWPNLMTGLMLFAGIVVPAALAVANVGRREGE